MSVFTRMLRVADVLGIVGALGFGAGTAVRAARSADCPFPPDPPLQVLPDGRKVLQRTRTSARDFTSGDPTPGTIP